MKNTVGLQRVSSALTNFRRRRMPTSLTAPGALLVSFCNLSAPGPALGVYDFETGELGWVPPPANAGPWVGVDGICRRDDGHWFLPQVAWGGISGLTRLDRDMRVTFHAQLKLARDAHSLVPFEDGFLVTDTQHNRLVLARPDFAHQRVIEEPFWAACCEDNHDVVHLNSVAKLGDDIFVSMFGPKPPAGWANSVDGQIKHAPSGTIVCRGIAHPHSLIAVDDSLYWLESAKGIMHSYRPSDQQRHAVELGGFARGLTFDGTSFYVGVSAARRRSRSAGVPNAPVAKSSQQAQSWICRVFPDGTGLRRQQLTVFGTEIYELERVERMAARQFLDRTADQAAVQRIFCYEDEIERLRDDIGCLMRQLTDLQSQRAGPSGEHASSTISSP